MRCDARTVNLDLNFLTGPVHPHPGRKNAIGSFTKKGIDDSLNKLQHARSTIFFDHSLLLDQDHAHFQAMARHDMCIFRVVFRISDRHKSMRNEETLHLRGHP